MTLAYAIDNSAFQNGFIRTLVSLPFLLAVLLVIWAYLPILTISVGIPVQDEGILFDPVYELIHNGRLAAPYMAPVGHSIDRVFWNHPPGNQYYMALFYHIIGDGLLAVRISAMFLRIVLIFFFTYLVAKGILEGWPTFVGIVVFLLSTYPVLSVSRPDMLAGTLFLGYLLLLNDGSKSLPTCVAAATAWALAMLCHPLTLHFGLAALLTRFVILILSPERRLQEVGRLLFLPVVAGALFVILWLLPFAALGGWADVVLVIKGFVWHSSIQSTVLSWFEPSMINMMRYLPHYLVLGLLICPTVLLSRNQFTSTDVIVSVTLLIGMLYILVFTFAGAWYFVTLAPAAVYLFSRWLGQSVVVRPALTRSIVALLGIVCVLTIHTSILIRHPYAMFVNNSAVYNRINEVTAQYIHNANVKSAVISPQFYHLLKLKTTTVDLEFIGRFSSVDDLKNYDAILLMDEHSGVFFRFSPEQLVEFRQRFQIAYDSTGRDWIRSSSIRSLGRPIHMPRFIVALRKQVSS